MNLWRFKIRRLGLTISDRVVSTHYATLSATTEKDAVMEIKLSKFRLSSWWVEHLIIEVEDLGELWWDEALFQLNGELQK